jgi:two-component system sensor histidine kinase VicK
LINTKKLKIKNKIPTDLNVWGDREKIKQVWQNLISNATKYSKNNSEIELNFKKDKKQGWIFFVKDQGVGIPKEQHHKIFTKFFRANNASLQDSDGTGLGLYIAREIMRAHKGDIWFDSILGKGSTFYFSLPLIPDKKDKHNLKTIKTKKKTNKS